MQAKHYAYIYIARRRRKRVIGLQSKRMQGVKQEKDKNDYILLLQQFKFKFTYFYL